ncbi:hypothetical protein [Nonomuraea sp. NPDC049158]|uniref:hypothetical protein n=1 Tax=Nonomuraea sp. NPDC049158 TaxID=3155649 RepID=UPI00340B8BC8
MAVVVTAICAATVLTSSSVSSPPTVLTSCPQQWGGRHAGGWVPAAGQIDGVGDYLVPGRPVTAMICAYPGDNTRMGGERLAGSRTLTGDAEAMARDLGYLPVSTEERDVMCTLKGGPMTNYLIRFAYPGGGGLWVGSAEEVNGCVRTTNGTVQSRSYVGRSLTAAYRTGTWRLVHPDDPCQIPGERRGQDERMVPDEPISVLVCRRATRAGERAPRREHDRRTAGSLAQTLNALDAGDKEILNEVSCDPADWFDLLFGYAEGPPVRVSIVLGCDHGVDNGFLNAPLDDALRDQIIRLAPPG